MANDFTQDQLDLILHDVAAHTFNEFNGDYIRVSVFDRSGNIVVNEGQQAIYYSNRDLDGNLIEQYTDSSSPEPILDILTECTGGEQYCSDIELEEDCTITGCLWEQDYCGNVGPTTFHCEDLSPNECATDVCQTVSTTLNEPQVIVYRDHNSNFYLKVNEILQTNNLPSDDYTVKYDILRNVVNEHDYTGTNLIYGPAHFTTDHWVTDGIDIESDVGVESNMGTLYPFADKITINITETDAMLSQRVPVDNYIIGKKITTTALIAEDYLPIDIEGVTTPERAFELHAVPHHINEEGNEVPLWNLSGFEIYGEVEYTTGDAPLPSGYANVICDFSPPEIQEQLHDHEWSSIWIYVIFARDDMLNPFQNDEVITIPLIGMNYGTGDSSYGIDSIISSTSPPEIPTTHFTVFNFGLDKRYIISEISPTRKEVRLLAKSNDNTFKFTQIFRDEFQSLLGRVSNNTYMFDYTLGISRARNLKIIGYEFDLVSNAAVDFETGDGVSLVIRLIEPLPSDITRLQSVNIEQLVGTTPEQYIKYISNQVFSESGTGLTVDTNFTANLELTDSTDDYQDLNDLTISGSISDLDDLSIEQQITSSDVNLNIDYSKFEHHVVFGSAVSKLENFKTKVGNIQNNLLELSQSLEYPTGSHVHERRKELFENIKTIERTFTPYEKFLYTDNQATTTASAPGAGKNLARSSPLDPYVHGAYQGSMTSLSNYEGFKTVYKLQGAESVANYVSPFVNIYHAENGPFYNDSGSFYLSFIVKADEGLDGRSGNALNGVWDIQNPNAYSHWGDRPTEAWGGGVIERHAVQSESYKRYIFEASQSYWEPSTGTPVSDIINSDSDTWNVLSGLNITGSGEIEIGTSDLPTWPGQYNPETTFTGSVLPSGPLFMVQYFNASTEITSSYITDVKVTQNNPYDCYPFTAVYKTGSDTFTNWYDGMHISASNYDDTNIHSLYNNLPQIVREDSGSVDLKRFINMIGEQFDLSRNYIDNYDNFYSRAYRDTQDISGSSIRTTPDNLLPILGDQLGWEFINPFTGSLSEYYSSLASGSSENISDITSDLWRKVLNNLIYIYKTKGTHSSLRALLNTYGYPSDILTVSEYAGSTEAHTLSNTFDTNDLNTGLNTSTNAPNYILSTNKFSMMRMSSSVSLSLDWWTNSANGDTIEFVMSPISGAYSQSLLHSSGSGTQSLWDMRMIPKSGGTSASLEFRLATSSLGNHPSTDHWTGSSFAMSTSAFPVENGDLYNVMLNRTVITSSGFVGGASGKPGVTQSYNIFIASQDGDKIKFFSSESIDVHHSEANKNFISGSANTQLIMGSAITSDTTGFSGSIAEIRLWSGSLSASKFKQHVYNKFSTAGNNSTSYTDDLIYHFKLNERYSLSHGTASSNTQLKDSSPRSGDYSFDLGFLSSNPNNFYSTREIQVYKLSTRLGGAYQKSNKMITRKSNKSMIRNLSPLDKSFTSIFDKDRIITTNLSIVRSPMDKVDDFIINNLSDFDLTQKFSDPAYANSSSYDELDKFRDEMLQNVTIDTNKFIEAQSQIFNASVISGMKKLIPARSNLENIGVEIRPTLLDRTKIKQGKLSLQTGSDAGMYNSSSNINISSTDSPINPVVGAATSNYQDIIEPTNAVLVSADGSEFHSVTGSWNPGVFEVDDAINIISSSNTRLLVAEYANIIDPSQDIEMIAPSPGLINLNNYSKIMSFNSSSDTSNIMPSFDTNALNITDSSYVTGSYMFKNAEYIPTYDSTYITSSAYKSIQSQYSDVIYGTEQFINISNIQSQSNSVNFTGSVFNVYDNTTPIQSSSGSLDTTEKLDIHESNNINYISDSALYSVRTPAQSASATWTFTDKGNEETTITLIDYEGTSVIFEVDNDGDGAVTGSAVAMDPPTNNGAGMASILVDSVNASSLKITGSSPSAGKVILIQEEGGTDGNTTITLSNRSNWEANSDPDVPVGFSGGVDTFYKRIKVNGLAEGSEKITIKGNLLNHTASLTNEKISEYTVISNIEPAANSLLSSSHHYNIYRGADIDHINVSGTSPDVFKSTDVQQHTASLTNEIISEHTSQTMQISTGTSSIINISTDKTRNEPVYSQSISILPTTYTTGSTLVTQHTGIATETLSSSFAYSSRKPYRSEHGILLGASGSEEDRYVKIFQKDTKGSWVLPVHYDDVIQPIGDNEYISCSMYHTASRSVRDTAYDWVWDFSNPHTVLNAKLIDQGKGYTYRSYYSRSGDFNHDMDGRPVGRTSYFASQSDGTIFYPSNHWIKIGRSKDALHTLFYGGHKAGVPRYDEDGNPFTSSWVDPLNRDIHPELGAYTITVSGSDTINTLKVSRK